MIGAVELPKSLQKQLRMEALAAYPRECCGLVEGFQTTLILRQAQDEGQKGESLTRSLPESLTPSLSKGEAGKSRIVQVSALHPMPNVAEQPERFEIDPAAHIALLRKLRGTGRNIIGCYHSHPNGRAEPSERDRARADEEGFLWLITAVDHEAQAAGTAAFVCVAQGFSLVPILHNTPGTAGACGRPPI